MRISDWSSDVCSSDLVAQNGMFSMVRAFLTNDAQYDGLYAGMPEAEALPLLRSIVAQDNTTFLTPDTTRSLMRHVDNGDRTSGVSGKSVTVLVELGGGRFIKQKIKKKESKKKI